MKTDDLIAALAADAVPGPRARTRVLQTLPFAVVAAIILVGLILGYRADVVVALGDPVSLMRYVLSLGLAGLAGLALANLSRPQDLRVAALWPLLSVPLIALGLWAIAWLSTDPGGVGMAIRGKTLVYCLVSIPSLSVLTTGSLIWALRQGAPLRPTLTGAIAGLAGGGLAAAAYALHCTEDNPLFYVTWYGTGILLSALGGALAGRRFLRW